ncbi:unnamed protein product [Soboliphyme baturini]|uniref:Transposase n=1 Tax=Soboliphyme baturini TaxID=241478 RepID=A0A183J8G4_9BILA|nr:unnamed protein product [Soboliphyme baturini]
MLLTDDGFEANFALSVGRSVGGRTAAGGRRYGHSPDAKRSTILAPFHCCGSRKALRIIALSERSHSHKT